MAVTTINLSDPVTTLVTKTNTVSSDLGDKATLTTTDKSNLVAAIHEINTQVNKVDSADVINLIQANSMDSSEVINLIGRDSSQANIMSNFQKDSANGIGFDSSQGRFFIPIGTVNTSMIEPNAITAAKVADDAIGSAALNSLSTLLIKDSAGSTLKTLHAAGV